MRENTAKPRKQRRWLRWVLWCGLGGLMLPGVLLGTALAMLAYGLPGRWINPLIAEALPSDTVRLTVGRVALRPFAGWVVVNLSLNDVESGKCYLSLKRGSFGFRLFSLEPIADRLTSATFDTLFVEQIDYTGMVPETEPLPLDQRTPFPDFSDIELPKFKNVALRFRNPDIVEVRMVEVTGTLNTIGKNTLRFSNLEGEAVAKGGQHVEADIDVDLTKAEVRAVIRGTIDHDRLHGIYRAVDFPIIEQYSSNFKTRGPTWADSRFTVGFDKYNNNFSLTVDILNRTGGTYCGVPFDEASATIRCRGIWDARTEIGPIRITRNDRQAALGYLEFDCPDNRFRFRAEGDGVSVADCLKIIDCPFTESIPPILTDRPPTVRLSGSIPLLTEQAPEHVLLEGFVGTDGPGSFERVPFASLHTQMSMKDGVFSLRGTEATLPHGGKLFANVDIRVPHSAEYTDINTLVIARSADIGDLLKPFGVHALPNSEVNGSLILGCRTDATFKTSLNADLDLKIGGGLVERLPIFAGFTDMIADHVPGVSVLTDTSDISLKGTVRNGLLTLPNFSLAGSLFSIEGPVTYSIPDDRLDAMVIVAVFRRESVLGTLTRWATDTVSKALWRVHIFGPAGNPEWKSIPITRAIYNTFTGQRIRLPDYSPEHLGADASLARPDDPQGLLDSRLRRREP